MAKFLLPNLIFLFLASLVRGKEEESSYAVSCPPEDVSLSMAGLIGNNRLVEAWKDAYQSEYCPGFDISFRDVTHGEATASVCASSLLFEPVDFAGMNGPFFPSQVDSEEGLDWRFTCKRSKEQRGVVLLQLGYEGVVVVTAQTGDAASCINLLGGGLTVHQIRWIFSDFDSLALAANGWDPDSVPFSDGDESTHLWSELNKNCSAVEIDIGLELRNDTNAFMRDKVMPAIGEGVRSFESFSNGDDVNAYMENHGNAVAFLTLHDMFSKEFVDRKVRVIGIRQEELQGGDVVYPYSKSFELAKYPLQRPVNVGLVSDTEALSFSRPFFEFGLSVEGTEILKELGYWPVQRWLKREMLSRLEIGHRHSSTELEEIQRYCGPPDGHTAIGGSETVYNIAHIWSKFYSLGCSVDIDLSEGGSTSGAHRVCGDFSYGYRFPVGMMGRDWDESEAMRRSQGFVYDCLVGDKTRSLIQIDVAFDGITLMFQKGSQGHTCIQLLGGLTMDQIRWMFSNYTDGELENTGWNPASLKNNDFDPSTHLWSELDERCVHDEINIAGDPASDGTFISLTKLVLTDSENGETIDTHRPKGYAAVSGFNAMKFLLENFDAVAFVGYGNYHLHQDVFGAAPIQNTKGEFILPSEETITDRTYPLIRPLYMNVLNDELTLRDAVPVIEYGYAHPKLLEGTGFVPIVGDRMEEMVARLKGGPYHDGQSHYSAASSTAIGALIGVVGAIMALME